MTDAKLPNIVQNINRKVQKKRFIAKRNYIKSITGNILKKYKFAFLVFKYYQKIKNSRYFDDLLEEMEIEANREVLQKTLQESAESGMSDFVI